MLALILIAALTVFVLFTMYVIYSWFRATVELFSLTLHIFCLPLFIVDFAIEFIEKFYISFPGPLKLIINICLAIGIPFGSIDFPPIAIVFICVAFLLILKTALKLFMPPGYKLYMLISNECDYKYVGKRLYNVLLMYALQQPKPIRRKKKKKKETAYEELFGNYFPFLDNIFKNLFGDNSKKRISYKDTWPYISNEEEEKKKKNIILKE